MGSPFAGFVLDPSECSKLTLEQKREIVYELSKSSQCASDLLQSWSRRELLQILCVEMGKERKYTGVTKMKMIEHLLKLVSDKRSCADVNISEKRLRPSPKCDNQLFPKKQKKTDDIAHLTAIAKQGSNDCKNSTDSDSFCKNSACRAVLRFGDTFCKRCSCCICYKYDDNKDPSIWLVCNSDPPHKGKSCGLSCHLECAFRDKRTGIRVGGIVRKLDCGFYCVSCKKVNALLECCRKQLLIAKETRRVDSLSYRIFLSRKLLNKTEKYVHIKVIVEAAAKKLEEEVGALDGLHTKMARGIVNRLSCGSEIQKLCVMALQLLDSSMDNHLQPQPSIHQKGADLESSICLAFMDISTTSVIVVVKSVDTATLGKSMCFKLWHREVEAEHYPREPTCVLFGSDNQFCISELSPGTAYMIKVVSSISGYELEKREEGFFTLNCNVKSFSISSSDGDESKTAEDQWPNNSLQSSEFIPVIPRNGGVPQHVCDNETRPIHVCESPNLETLVGSGSISDLNESGSPASTSNLIIQEDSQRGSTDSLEENQAFVVPAPENKNHSESITREDTSIDDESNAMEREAAIQANQSDTVLPSTPCKQEMRKDVLRNTVNWSLETEKGPQPGSWSKKSTRCQPDNIAGDGAVKMDYEYCVKVFRWLECEGHIQKSFREKFLTWFSLRATAQEKKIVRVFVETLIDDPPSLAGQLMDTFSEGICNRRSLAAAPGFCMKLWH